MKSIIHFHNNISVKTAGIMLFTLLTACYGIQSQFGKNSITQNKKVCFTGYINSNPARLFVREFYDVYGEHQIPDCDYLVYVMITETSVPKTIIAGLEYFELQKLNAMYSVYRFNQDTKKVQKVQSIIDNPTVIKHETYTESFGRGAIANRINNSTRRKLYDTRSYNKAYYEDKKRFSQVLKNVGGGSYNEFLHTQQNPIVLTSSTTARDDGLEQMSKSLAKKVIGDVGLIIDADLNPVDVKDNKDDTKTDDNQIEPKSNKDAKVDNFKNNQQQKVQHNKTIRKISDVIK